MRVIGDTKVIVVAGEVLLWVGDREIVCGEVKLRREKRIKLNIMDLDMIVFEFYLCICYCDF